MPIDIAAVRARVAAQIQAGHDTASSANHGLTRPAKILFAFIGDSL